MESEKSVSSENKMGYMPINKLIINMSLPMMISMLVQACYNIVDSVFVARIDKDALAAISLAFPIQNLMIAVATGTGVGVNALLSMRLGQKRQLEVNKTAENGIFLLFCSFLVFFILGFFLPEPFFASQAKGSENLAVVKYGKDYLSICLIGSMGLFCGIIFERLLQATGRTLLSMIGQLSGAVTNIVLDPLLIFGIGPFPVLGIKGAAIATIIGQFVTLIVAFILNKKYNPDIHFSIRKTRPDKDIILSIYKVGIPSILLASIGSVMTFGMNKILIAFSMAAVNVFGIYFKLQSFIFMPIFGLNNGVVPVVAFNYGAQHKRRIIQAIKFSAMLAISIMTFGMILFEIAPGLLLSFFNADEEILHIGKAAFRIIAIHFPIAAVSILFTSIYQALGKGVFSMLVSFVRQLIVLLPVSKLLSLTQNVNNIWWAFPIAEIVAITVSSFFMKKIYRDMLKNLPE